MRKGIKPPDLYLKVDVFYTFSNLKTSAVRIGPTLGLLAKKKKQANMRGGDLEINKATASWLHSKRVQVLAIGPVGWAAVVADSARGLSKGDRYPRRSLSFRAVHPLRLSCSDASSSKARGLGLRIEQLGALRLNGHI